MVRYIREHYRGYSWDRSLDYSSYVFFIVLGLSLPKCDQVASILSAVKRDTLRRQLPLQ